MTDPQTTLRKLIGEHADRLYRVAPSDDGTGPFNAHIDDEDAHALAAALFADERFIAVDPMTESKARTVMQAWRRIVALVGADNPLPLSPASVVDRVSTLTEQTAPSPAGMADTSDAGGGLRAWLDAEIRMLNVFLARRGAGQLYDSARERVTARRDALREVRDRLPVPGPAPRRQGAVDLEDDDGDRHHWQTDMGVWHHDRVKNSFSERSQIEDRRPSVREASHPTPDDPEGVELEGAQNEAVENRPVSTAAANIAVRDADDTRVLNAVAGVLRNHYEFVLLSSRYLAAAAALGVMQERGYPKPPLSAPDPAPARRRWSDRFPEDEAMPADRPDVTGPVSTEDDTYYDDEFVDKWQVFTWSERRTGYIVRDDDSRETWTWAALLHEQERLYEVPRPTPDDPEAAEETVVARDAAREAAAAAGGA